jgi:hypothetical protein
MVILSGDFGEYRHARQSLKYADKTPPLRQNSTQKRETPGLACDLYPLSLRKWINP